MTNVQNPIYITSYYPTLPTDPTADTAMAVTATTPIWKNITIKNVTVTGSTQRRDPLGPAGGEDLRPSCFDNVKISGHHRHGDLPRHRRLVHQRLERHAQVGRRGDDLRRRRLRHHDHGVLA